jgi:hypothetical protein
MQYVNLERRDPAAETESFGTGWCQGFLLSTALSLRWLQQLLAWLKESDKPTRSHGDITQEMLAE